MCFSRRLASSSDLFLDLAMPVLSLTRVTMRVLAIVEVFVCVISLEQ